MSDYDACVADMAQKIRPDDIHEDKITYLLHVPESRTVLMPNVLL